jgi:hypothetical protein
MEIFYKIYTKDHVDKFIKQMGKTVSLKEFASSYNEKSIEELYDLWPPPNIWDLYDSWIRKK